MKNEKLVLFVLLISGLLLSFFYSFIFIYEWNSRDITLIFTCFEDECSNLSFNSFGFIPYLFSGYFLISLNVILLVALIKGGLNNLKSFKDGGLIFELIFGLLLGFLGGFLGGLLFGLISGILFGLLLGCLGGLLLGIFSGLINEFDNKGRSVAG